MTKQFTAEEFERHVIAYEMQARAPSNGGIVAMLRQAAATERELEQVRQKLEDTEKMFWSVVYYNGGQLSVSYAALQEADDGIIERAEDIETRQLIFRAKKRQDFAALSSQQTSRDGEG